MMGKTKTRHDSNTPVCQGMGRRWIVLVAASLALNASLLVACDSDESNLSDVTSDTLEEDTATDGDAAQADTAETDTTSLDTESDGGDNGDTTAADTIVADTTVADTTVADTTVADTTVADTAVVDTSGDVTDSTDTMGPSGLVGVLANGQAADFSCLGNDAAPQGQAPASNTFEVTNFSSGAPVKDLTAHVFPLATIPTDQTCGAGCEAATTDLDGEFTATTQADAWVHVLTLAAPSTPPEDADPVLTLNSNMRVKDGVSTLVVVSDAGGRDETVASLGKNRLAGSGLVIGVLRDCTSRSVENARLEIYVDATEVLHTTNDREPVFGYLADEGVPAPVSIDEQPLSTDNGIYFAANLPIGKLRVEVWGALTDDGPDTLLGCEESQTMTDGATFLDIRPLRSDAPSGCGT